MLIFVILFIAAIVFFLKRGQKRNLLSTWQIAASALDNFRCIPGGTITGYPSLTGMIEGRRIDVAPFFHREFGSSTSRMTGYRVRCDHAVELPPEAIANLTDHFRNFEHASRQIFCATAGVEELSASLITGVRKIAAALRQADMEAERKAQAQAPKVKNLVSVRMEPRGSEPVASKEPVAALVYEPTSPPALPDPEAQPDKASGSASPQAGAQLATVLPVEPEANPAPEPEPEIPALRAPIPQNSLTRTALDLFAQGRNRFEITQHFDAAYSGREIEGSGILQRVDTFSNDRILGRGPGVVAEIEVALPAPTPPPPADTGEEIPASSTQPRSPRSVRVYVVLPVCENVTPGAQARELREDLGKQVEVCGTLLRCDPFDARLHLIDGVLG